MLAFQQFAADLQIPLIPQKDKIPEPKIQMW
jgi:hypothetical protein